MISRRTFTLSSLAALVRTCFGPLFATSSKALAQALKDADSLTAGPLIGHTTANASLIWMYTPKDVHLQVRYATDLQATAVKQAKVEPIPIDDLDLRGQAWKATLTDLKPLTRYEFEVALNGKVTPEHQGAFRTSPIVGQSAKFRLGITSCMKIEKPQTSWPLFLKDEPDLHLTLGDTVYADTTNPTIQWQHHLRYRQSPEFASVIRAMPTYSMWDDHDYADNNSDGKAKGKENSLSGWKRVWLNPGAGTEELPGAFYRFSWGDVDFFLADGRYYRSSNKAKDKKKKTMLGKEQFMWLVDGLKSSKAKFKIVASGSTLHHSEHDGWRKFTQARHDFFDVIKANNISGVVYLSGSLHQSLVWEHHESKRVGYPMVEVISSGIANSKKLGYALIDFDTTLDDPKMKVRIVNGTKKGKAKTKGTWRLSELSHG